MLLNQRPRIIIPHPKTQREGGSRRMTLVAGFRCQKGGVLLCADRQEENDPTKPEVEKIYRIPVTQLQTCDVFLAGAGSSALLLKAHDMIHSCLLMERDKGTDILKNHMKLIEGILREFYKEYESELQNDFMGFLVVIAPLDPRLGAFLYRTHNALLVPCQEYYCQGTGRYLADYFSGRLFKPGRMDKKFLAILAAFILREAEYSVSGVGLGGDMIFIHDGDSALRHLGKENIREIQDGIPPLEEAIFSRWGEGVKMPDWLQNI